MVKELTIVNQVENRVKEFRTNGDIKFPPTYIPENVLNYFLFSRIPAS